MTTNAPRAPINFDAFERELHPSLPEAAALSHAPAGHPAEAGKSDPLAELARIVGQDDPFRALLEARGTARPAGRIEPSLQEASPPHFISATTPADAFDRYLASVEQSHHEAGQQDAMGLDAEDHTYRHLESAKPRRRGRLVQVGAGLSVLVVCVSGALAWRGMHGGASSNGPVTVLADKSPLKVAPEKADGVDIPDQNKQIYDRTAKDNQIKVVNREEQPLDVAQAARAISKENGSQSAAQSGVTPGGPGLLTDSLGEPRRIRTVAVKPDTPPPAVQQQAETATPEAKPETRQAAISPIPTMTLPDSESTATPASPAQRPARASTVPAAKPIATPAALPPVEAASSEETPAKPVTPRRATRRVASVSPDVGIATSEPETTAAPAAVSTGGFAVQLGVRNSEAEARTALQQMQAKHAQLAGKPALIRQAELNGKSFYRVRVGPFAKSEATGLCAALKDAGSACFVASN